MKVAFVLGVTTGGTVRHVRMLADGLGQRGVAVTVFGPARTQRAFSSGSAGPEGSGLASAAGSFAGPQSAIYPERERDGALPGDGAPGIAAGGGAPARFVLVEMADRPRPLRDAATVFRLRRLLAESGADVVHAHGLRAGAAAALALAPVPWSRATHWFRSYPINGIGPKPLDLARPALLVTVHNAPVAGGVTGAVYGVLERIVSRRADAVLCVSGDLAARMRRLGAVDTGLAVVPATPSAAGGSALGVPVPGGPGPGESGPGGSVRGAAVAAVRAELGAEGRPVALAVGRLAAQKGFGTLIDAASRWREREPAPLLVIAGEGPLLGQLSRQAGPLGLAVRFLGQRADVPALLAAADVVVVPSRWEGQPLIVQEALRAGRPLVATAVGGIPDLTGSGAAVLVPPDDPDRLAAAVCSVLDDPGLAARLAAAALERASSLPSESDAVDAAVAEYRRLAGGTG